MKIGHIDLSSEVMVIAEIGNNHEGSVELARDMILAAATAGAHAVKFQTIIPEQLIAPDQTERLNQLRRYQLSLDDHIYLFKVATDNGLMFMSTPFSLKSVDMLNPMVPAFKIASGDNNHFALLEKVASTGKPVFLSTGMADIDNIASSVGIINRAWVNAGVVDPCLVLLHCVSAYPTPFSQANLLAMRKLAELGYLIGYSDHTLGIEAAVLSVALGARVIEKHFTLSKTQSDFRDHQLSAEPHELKQLVESVAEANILLGDGHKRIMLAEEGVAQSARRSICAARNLSVGTVLKIDDLTWLRPAGGLEPGSESLLLGRRLVRSVAFGQRLSLDLVEG